MKENDHHGDEQENSQQKGDAEPRPADIANTVGHKPDRPDHDKKHSRRTQQDDDDAGYRRDWYSPKDPGVVRNLNVKRWQEYSPFITVALSAVALAVIIWQATIIINQNDLMEKQNKEMRDTREVENRAWVGVKVATWVTVPDGVSIATTYVNAGNVPATGTLIINAKCLKESPPDDVSYERPTTKGSQMIFMPKAELVDETARLKGFPLCGDQLPPSKKDLTAPIIERYNLPEYFYVFGEINYEDGFGKHRSKFCSFSVPTTREAPPFFAACPTHNTFD